MSNELNLSHDEDLQRETPKFAGMAEAAAAAEAAAIAARKADDRCFRKGRAGYLGVFQNADDPPARSMRDDATMAEYETLKKEPRLTRQKVKERHRKGQSFEHRLALRVALELSKPSTSRPAY